VSTSTAAAPPSQNLAALADKLLVEYQRDNPEESTPERDDRRKSPRRHYECWQLVAEFDGEKLPAQQDFHLCRFHDISSGGISFLADRRPRSDELVIALGSIPFVFFHVHVVRAVLRQDLDEATMQIGCRFVKRIP
jgi:hypothetical protein